MTRGESEHHTFAITVNNVNDAPDGGPSAWTAGMPTKTEPTAVNLGNVFADVDGHDSLSYRGRAP